MARDIEGHGSELWTVTIMLSFPVESEWSQVFVQLNCIRCFGYFGNIRIISCVERFQIHVANISNMNVVCEALIIVILNDGHDWWYDASAEPIIRSPEMQPQPKLRICKLW